MNCTHIGFLACTLFALGVSAALPPLFRDGASDWKVVVAADAAAPEKFGAEEFTRAVEKISGVKLETVASTEGLAHAVVIGGGRDDNFADEKVEYRVERGNLLLTGNQPRAVLHAVYAFLQRELDVRWLWPGADGEVTPSLKTWSIPEKLTFSHKPSIKYRGFHHCGDWRGRNEFNLWQTRNFANIHRHGVGRGEEKYGQYSMLSTHSANLNGDQKFFAEHPECFAFVGGHRSMVNICFSSDLGAQKVAEKLAKDIARRQKANPVDLISIFPNDNQDYCQCEKCKPLGVSNSWFRYFNKVVAALHAEFPKLRFATLAYQGYLDVPDCGFSNVEFIEYASHPRCHIHTWGDAACASNASELKRLRQWTARGDVAIGHYAYEYDNGGRHPIFMPFFTMIADAVETCAKEGLVTSIPEVSLSPKSGPDVKAHAIQNRLSILLYAWKMWNVDLTLDEFFDDMTKHAFGPAAADMKEYFKLLDAGWNAQPGRISLFADGMNMATGILKDEKTRMRAPELLAAAEKKVAGDERFLRNVLREKALYAQISDARELRLGNLVAVNLPRLGEGERLADEHAPWHVLLTKDRSEGAAKVRAAWNVGIDKKTKKEVLDSITVVWTGTQDGEATFTSEAGEKFVFGYAGGRKSEKWVSDVGVTAVNWKPEWQVQAAAKELVFTIPAAVFATAPRQGDMWEARFTAGAEALPVREDVGLKVNFLHAGAVDRPVLYSIPTLRNLQQRNSMVQRVPSVKSAAERDGWKLLVATNAAEVAAAATKTSTYMFLCPIGNEVTPETAAVIRENVKKGGTLLARSWATVPLAKLLGDPSVKSAVAAPKDYPLSERHVKYVREGDWCKAPWNFEGKLRRGFSPCYMQVGFEPVGAWVAYASMPSRQDESKLVPFVTAMKYGEGCIILVGETLNVSHFQLIDNLRRDLGICPNAGLGPLCP